MKPIKVPLKKEKKIFKNCSPFKDHLKIDPSIQKYKSFGWGSYFIHTSLKKERRKKKSLQPESKPSLDRSHLKYLF